MTWQKIILYSTHPHEIRPWLSAYGFEELAHSRASKPQMIVTYGGDGTFLTAEREWPGVPKLILRRSRVCQSCLQNAPKKMLEHVAQKKITVREFPKIVFSMGLTDEVAANDIILRNLNPNQALRFCLEDTDGGVFPQGEIIGDGLVLATAIGARAYYRSITRKGFQSTFGMAFNNPTKALEPVDLNENFQLTVRILRESGLLCVDNLPAILFLKHGDVFTLRRHPEFTRVIDLLDYYCAPCREELRF